MNSIEAVSDARLSEMLAALQLPIGAAVLTGKDLSDVRQALIALQSLRSPIQGEVKALEWQGSEARSAAGNLYSVCRLSDAVWQLRWNGTDLPGWYSSKEDAQAAAQSHALSSPAPEPIAEAVAWRPIETHSDHFGVLVSRTPDKYIYGPLAAFLDVTGVWRVLGSEGGMTELPFEPTHWQPLPLHVGASQPAPKPEAVSNEAVERALKAWFHPMMPPEDEDYSNDMRRALNAALSTNRSETI
jgi:hypothetical protein